jgi:outer membrane protein assembly factor BamB
MKQRKRARQTVAVVAACAFSLLSGCHSDVVGHGDYAWIGGARTPPPGKGALRVQWRRELTPARRGAYVPVENAAAGIDAEHERLYVGAASGELHALAFDGRLLYRFDLHDPIECEPAVDAQRDELYVGTERGDLYALKPGKGIIRWKISARGAIRQRPLLAGDAVYVVTEDDVVEAYSRSDGSVLWTYQREPEEGFLVTGHAGLALFDGKLLTAFNDGTVVALDALDGRVRWERSTAVDVPETDPGRPRYTDVDTTPVRIGDAVYVASFGAGLYALELSNGSVRFRDPEWTGITGLAVTSDGTELIVASADRGLARLEPATRTIRWLRPVMRGSLGTPVVARGLVVLGESKGSLLAISERSGDELSRIDTGHGFVARAVLDSGRAYVVSNGGTLLGMRVVIP